jgi:D-xylose transport system substrate-binding protein
VTKFPRTATAILIVAVAASAIVAATSASTKKANATTADICVLLPDSKSSVRWETQDRPRLAAAFKSLGDTYSIVNAEGSASTQLNQAQQCLTNGAKVILLVNLDSGSGAAIQKLAKSKGAQSIDYDRLTLKGDSSYYVSFDNVKVGQLQGQGLINCLNASGAMKNKPVIATLNGAPTDNNAKLFAQGYNGVLKNVYSKGTAIKGPDQSVPQWDNQKALTIFQGMLTKTSNKINAVLAANDGLGNAAISALKSAGLPKIPVTGQDATAQGIQNIISGWQCMTVYKSIKAEADAAATVADGILHAKPINTKGQTTNDGKRNVPSVLLTPVGITKNNWTLLISDGFLKKSEVCKGEYAQYC